MNENKEKEYSPIYKIIDSLCKKYGISVTKLCTNVTGSKGNLPTWQKGSINAQSLIKIADYFNCSVDFLLGRTDKPKPEAETEAETHIEQNHQFIQNDNSPIVLSVPTGTELDEMQKELLSRFGKLQFTDKIDFMQQLVEKTEGSES